ncbi:MAG: hypothetical protein HY657_04265 [Acidobacteria bacterium]|nr:hypothetical protein [Acidobacteriota bacterium]
MAWKTLAKRAMAGLPRLPSSHTRELAAAVEALRVQTEQLVAIERLNAEQEEDVRKLDVLFGNRACISAHVRAAVESATLDRDPFPHIVVDRWLPDDVYQTMLRALPPAVFFVDRVPMARHRLLVPFDFGPLYSRRVWRFIAQDIVEGTLGPALQDRFREPPNAYIGTFCPRWLDEPDQRLRVSDGRIMLRRPGYVIDTHRDPKWGFLTALIYLARDGDNEAYGTQLYRVRDDVEAQDEKPLRLDPKRCELVKSAPFRPNTLLAFLNSTGAHGAAIPSGSTPPTLERYVYQVRMGPDSAGIRRMVSLMSSERSESWSGKKLQRAVGERHAEAHE